MPAERVERKLAAILAADVAGYSRLMGADEAGTARVLREHRATIDPIVASYGGRIVKTTGDGLLLEFPSIVAAVECAVAVQKLMAERNAEVPQDRRMLFRIGINLGDVLVEDDDILGDGVNIAARLEGIAEPGGICISESSYQQVRDKLDIRFQDMGEHRLKNIARPVRAYRVPLDAPPAKEMPALGLSAVLAAGDETIDSVAVLPFVNTSDDPNTEYLSDGIAETLISSLTQLRGLRVMARGTVFRFKGQDVDPQKIGRDLQVRAVLTGRLMQRGDTLTFQTELVDVAKGSRLWGAHYDRKLADVLGVQEEIAQEISQNLRLRLTGEDQKRLAKSATSNSEAYQDYLKGRYWWNKATEEGFDKGIEFFRRAIAKDPTYAHAYSGLADCYSSLAGNGFISAKDGYLKAKDAALKALEFDDTLAEAHTSLALIKTSYDWDWSGAAREFKRAIALNPSYAEAHQFYAQALWQMGRIDEAIAESRLTLEFDPLSLGANADLGVAFFLARRYDRVIEQEGKVLELDPALVDAYYFRGVAYIKKSMYVEAMAEFEKGVAIAPDSLVALTGVGYGYAVTGRKSEAQQVLDKLSALSTQKYVSPVWMAKVYAGLEDKDKAFEWLEKAYGDRSIVSVGYVKTNPIFDPLRSDPRYADLLRRTHLSP